MLEIPEDRLHLVGSGRTSVRKEIGSAGIAVGSVPVVVVAVAVVIIVELVVPAESVAEFVGLVAPVDWPVQYSVLPGFGPDSDSGGLGRRYC